ncbi:hypothetical protein KKH56_01825 [bacterium]|nr:hypothetical protein [bacterium]
MRVDYLSSYDRSFRRLNRKEQEKTIEAIDLLVEAIKGSKKPKGLGLKKVRKDYWEIRIGISKRIIFRFEPQALIVTFVGDHEEIKRFLGSS